MTNDMPRPSLSQADDALSHSHSHSHSYIHRSRHDTARVHHFRHHYHHHDREEELDTVGAPAARLPRDDSDVVANAADADANAINADSLVSQTLQTAPRLEEVSTVAGRSDSLVVGSASDNTFAISSQDLHATPAIPGSDRGASSQSTSSPPSYWISTTAIDTTTTSTTTSAATTAIATTSSSEASGLASPPLSSSSVYLIVGSIYNGTNTLINNASSSLIPTSSLNSSTYRVSSLSAPTSLSFTSSGANSSLSTTFTSLSTITKSTPSSTSSRSATYTSTESTSTSLDGDLVASLPPGGAQPAPTLKSDDGGGGSGNDNKLSPEQRGAIVGTLSGVAGVAFFAVLILMALKYRKRRDARALLGGGHSGTTASRSLIGGDSRAMTERSAPSAVTAALSSLTGKRSAPQTADSAEGGERGFYRVAGRKLPSVLHTGGDGYSDPRESVVSGGSDYYRGSQASDPVAAGSVQLALGSPMRPVSGIPVMRPSPARTPVTTENPFVDPPPSPPLATEDTLDRPPGSRDGPRATVSKFQEKI